MELCLHSLMCLLGTDVRIITDLKHSDKNSILKCIFIAYFTELNTFYYCFISSLARKYFIYVIVLDSLGCILQQPGDHWRNAMLMQREHLKELYSYSTCRSFVIVYSNLRLPNFCL